MTLADDLIALTDAELSAFFVSAAPRLSAEALNALDDAIDASRTTKKARERGFEIPKKLDAQKARAGSLEAYLGTATTLVAAERYAGDDFNAIKQALQNVGNELDAQKRDMPTEVFAQLGSIKQGETLGDMARLLAGAQNISTLMGGHLTAYADAGITPGGTGPFAGLVKKVSDLKANIDGKITDTQALMTDYEAV